MVETSAKGEVGEGGGETEVFDFFVEAISVGEVGEGVRNYEAAWEAGGTKGEVGERGWEVKYFVR